MIFLKRKKNGFDFIKKGDFIQATPYYKKTWTSLPGASQDPGKTTAEDLAKVFLKYYQDELNNTSIIAAPLGSMTEKMNEKKK